MAQTAETRVALVGYGLAGRFFHAPLIAATEGLSLTTVVTANPVRRAEVAREHPNAGVLNSIEELWVSAQPDLVVVAAPNRVHAQLATEAIGRGIAVVVDKPLALSSAEAQTLVDRAERAGVLLSVFQNRRWDSDHLTVTRLLAGNHLGRVLRYESRFERWQPTPRTGAWREISAPERGGGVLLDLGSHLVDQATVLFGEVTQVYAEVDARRGTPGDDDAFLALRHHGGVISHLRASSMTAAPGPRLRVLGDSAAFVQSALDSQEDRLRAGERPDTAPDWGLEPDERRGRLVTGRASVPIPSERGDWPRFYSLLRAALVAGEPPPVDPRDAVRTLRILELARQSASERAVIALT